MGKGKKQERTLFFPFPFLHFLAPFFSRFWTKSLKKGKKLGETVKKWLERCGKGPRGRPSPFQILKFGEIPFFILVRTHS